MNVTNIQHHTLAKVTQPISTSTQSAVAILVKSKSSIYYRQHIANRL